VNNDITPHIHWVSGHEDIKDNEIADEAAKLSAKFT